MKKTKLILVRHGMTDDNSKEVFCGITDSPLSELGYQQAEAVAEKLYDLTNIDAIYCSPLKRTLDTAYPIANKFNREINILDDLKEINGGDWEYKTHEYIAMHWPKEYIVWQEDPGFHQMPNGDSVESLQKKLITAVNNIIEQNQGQTVCLMTHGVSIRLLMCYFHGLKLEDVKTVKWCNNTGINIIEHDNLTKELSVVLEGYDCHLEKKDLKVHSHLDMTKFVNIAKREVEKAELATKILRTSTSPEKTSPRNILAFA